MPEKEPTCAVLVTGGAGFLGQHVVGLLQKHASHVTEIRVLDVIPYVNKLEHCERLPVKVYTGSITDEALVNKACKGANSVLHIASFVDTTLIPDKDRSYAINVKGTQNVIKACQKLGVDRLIYCSSTEVVHGKDNIYGGNEDNTQVIMDGHFFETYGYTKSCAEHMVLQANSDQLKTISLRPTVMYGELECRSWERICNNAITRRTGTYFPLRCGNSAKMEHAYVGNVAWGFICAEKTLHTNDERARTAAGQCFFIGDDSPKMAFFDFMRPFMEDMGLKPFPVEVPLSLIIYPLYIITILLNLVSYVYKVNLPHGVAAFAMITKVFLFQYSKATRYLDYKPLYSFTEAKSRTVKFWNKIKLAS